MTYDWFDNSTSGGFGDYGICSEGVIERGSGGAHIGQFTEGIFFGNGTPTALVGGERVCRPPTGTGHFLRHLVVWWTDASMTTSVDGTHDLYDTDYLKTVDPAYPTGYSGDDITASLTAPAGATYWSWAILDEGPYDGSGTTSSDPGSYSPYTAADTAVALLSACSAAPDLSGFVHAGEVHFS
jgi:hypothetical protein